MTVDFERHSYLEIHDRQQRSLVALIELLSPSNKRTGEDHEQYLAKRWKILRSQAHLIEIDLLRGGPRMPVKNLPECDYCVMVSRAEDRPKVGLWPIGLRDPLPTVPIPLRSSKRADLDLREALNRAYDRAIYEQYIYQGEPQPKLRPADAEWAQQFIPTR